MNLSPIRFLSLAFRGFSLKNRLPKKSSIYYDDSETSWEKVVNLARGYSDEAILGSVLKASLRVQEGEASYERDGVAFKETDFVWPVACMISVSAAASEGALRLLDFGGSLGTAYFQNRPVHRYFSGVDWRIVEQPNYVMTARQKIRATGLSFYLSIAEACEGFSPSVTLAGSSLQYLEKPLETLRDLAKITEDILVIDRLPLTEVSERLVLQTVPEDIYPASYPMHVMNYSQIMELLAEHWTLLARYPAIGGEAETTSGMKFRWEGLIFVRSSLD